MDKGRGAGGRSSTRRVGHGGGDITFDHGAQYFTARDERFRERVRQWMAAGVCQPWQGTIASVDEPGSVTPKEGGPIRYAGTPGMSAIVSAMARDVPVRFSCTVEYIERSGDAWVVHASDGQARQFDALVIATPAPQVASLLSGVSDVAERARACEMRPCWAVMAAFEHRLPIEADGVFVNIENQPLAWIARDSSKPGRPRGERWVLHAGPQWSQANIERERADVVTTLLRALVQALRIEVPSPMHAAAHRWRYALTHSQVEGGCILDPTTRLAVAGDWCHGGRVEGAYLSGLAAGERLLECMRR